MNNIPNNPADLVAHAAFFESKGDYNSANQLLNEFKIIFENFPSKEVALEEFKKLTSSVNPKQTTSNLNYFYVWICLRWAINLSFDGMNIPQILKAMANDGLHQLRRDIFTELSRQMIPEGPEDKKTRKSLKNIFFSLCSELDLKSAKKKCRNH